MDSHGHGPNVSEADTCSICIEERVLPQLEQHAGHGPWGMNDGSVRGVLEGWGLPPIAFIQSLNAWGYRIVVGDSEGGQG